MDSKNQARGTEKAEFIIEGCRVTATFSTDENDDALRQVKQILLSAFVAHPICIKSGGTFAISPKKRENVSGSEASVP